jgi:Protein of unknown function (DUF2809)
MESIAGHRRRLGPAVVAAVMFVALAAIVLFQNVLPAWFRSHLGDALTCVMVYMAMVAVAPKLAPAIAFCGTLGLACLVEFSQLLGAGPLHAWRQTDLGRLLIGSSFDPWDFLWYATGCAAALGVDLILVRKRRS